MNRKKVKETIKMVVVEALKCIIIGLVISIIIMFMTMGTVY